MLLIRLTELCSALYVGVFLTIYTKVHHHVLNGILFIQSITALKT